jgi:HEPN domain-containing protein
MDKSERVTYWLEIAEYDLETAFAMQQTKRYLYVGFMCHQVIEKMLKAYYCSVNENTPPYTHSLSRLAEHSSLLNEMTEEQLAILDELEPLNIEARYPSYKERLMKSLDENRCNKILLDTQNLQLWIKARL